MIAKLVVALTGISRTIAPHPVEIGRRVYGRRYAVSSMNGGYES